MSIRSIIVRAQTILRPSPLKAADVGAFVLLVPFLLSLSLYAADPPEDPLELTLLEEARGDIPFSIVSQVVPHAGRIYVRAAEIHVFEHLEPGTVGFLGRVNLGQDIRQLAPVGEHLGVVESRRGFSILDMTNPLEPLELGHYPVPVTVNAGRQAADIYIDGLFAYLILNVYSSFLPYVFTEVSTLDIRNPMKPVRVGGTPESIGTGQGRLSGHYIYGRLAEYKMNGEGDHYWWLVDVRNPATITTTKERIGFRRNEVICSVRGYYCVTLDTDYGIRIYDISNPGVFTFLGGYPVDSPRDVALDGNFAYVTSMTTGLHLINITDASNPVRRGGNAITDAGPIAIENSRVWIATRQSLLLFEAASSE